MHLKLISFSATAPGADGAAAVALAGDSLVVENNQGEMRPSILRLWGFNQTSGYHQLSFPSGHDTTRGYRYGVPADETSFRLPRSASIPLVAQETLSFTIAGSATAGDVEMGSALLFYPNLPGTQSRGISMEELQNRMEKMTTIRATVASSSNVYVEELINAESNLLMANRDYAVLGMESTESCLAITLRGPDTGNVRVGVPGGDGLQNFDSNFFCDLAQDTGLPVIPVINSGNRDNTFLGVAMNEIAGNIPVTLYLALLSERK